MNVRVLDLLEKNCIIFYELVAHTSGKTHPCDDKYKMKLKHAIADPSVPFPADKLDVLEFFWKMRQAISETFTF